MSAIGFSSPWQSGVSWRAYALLLCALAALFYAPLSDHLLDTHDADYWADSARIVSDPAAFFAVDKRMPGRPFFELFLLIEYALWGENPRLFHWAGIGLHALAAWVVAFCSWRLWGRRLLAQLAGGLFVCSCAPFQAVQWISAHCYSLALICMGLCLWGFVECAERDRPRAGLGSVVALLAGVLTHISAVTVVPFALWVVHRRGALSGLTLFRGLAMGGGALALVFAIKSYYTGAPQNTIAATGFDGMAAAKTYLFLWGRLLLSTFWMPARPDLVAVGEPAVGAVACCLGAWILLRYRGEGAFALAWIALALLPILSLAPEYVRSISAGPSRYLYISCVGMAFVWAMLLLDMEKRLRHRWNARLSAWCLAGAVAVLALSGWSGVQRAEAVAYYNEGRNYLAAGDIERGIEQLERALEIEGGTIDREDVYVRLCPMLLNQGRSVHEPLGNARALYPRNVMLHIYDQVVLSIDGDAAALAHLEKFKGNKSVGKVIAEAYHHAGRGAYRRADYAESVAALSRALAFDASRSDTRQSLRAAQVALRDPQ